MNDTTLHPLAADVADVAADLRLTADGTIDRRFQNPGRPRIFDDKWGIIEGLKIVADSDKGIYTLGENAPMSRPLTLQLVELGYLEIVKLESTTRGRKPHGYRLTGKARSYLSLSKRWKKPEDQ